MMIVTNLEHPAKALIPIVDTDLNTYFKAFEYRFDHRLSNKLVALPWDGHRSDDRIAYEGRISYRRKPPG